MYFKSYHSLKWFNCTSVRVIYLKFQLSYFGRQSSLSSNHSEVNRISTNRFEKHQIYQSALGVILSVVIIAQPPHKYRISLRKIIKRDTKRHWESCESSLKQCELLRKLRVINCRVNSFPFLIKLYMNELS